MKVVVGWWLCAGREYLMLMVVVLTVTVMMMVMVIVTLIAATSFTTAVMSFAEILVNMPLVFTATVMATIAITQGCALLLLYHMFLREFQAIEQYFEFT